jgi:site-specific recombinase XerD
LPENPELEGLIARYLTACVDRGLSPLTVKAYTLDLRQFVVVALSAVPTRDDLAAFRTSMAACGPASRLRKLTCLCGFCHWLMDEGRLDSWPFKKNDFRVKVPRTLPRNLPIARVRDLLAELTGKRFHKMVVTILLFSGLRITELCSLCISDFDRERGTLRVTGKGNRQRCVPITDRETVDGLRRYLAGRKGAQEESAPLLLNRRGRRLAPQSVRVFLRKYAPGVTPHMFRHTCATLFCEANMNPRHIQRLLGHASLSTTERYLNLSEASLASAMSEHSFGRKLGRANVPVPD